MTRTAAEVFRYREMPTGIERIIRAKLDRFADLVPAWCDHVNIWFDETNKPPEEGVSADAVVHYPYRWARIMIYSQWLSEPPEVQDDTLCHEVTHIVLGPFVDWTRDILQKLVPEDEDRKFHGVLLREFTERVESVVQDLTYQRLGRIAGEKPKAMQRKKKRK